MKSARVAEGSRILQEEDQLTGFGLSGLPPGVSASIVFNVTTQLAEIVLTGTPTQTGQFQVEMLGYLFEPADGEDPSVSEYPTYLSFPITIGNVLPATGPMDAAPAGLVALALLGLGGAVVFVTARTRQRRS